MLRKASRFVLFALLSGGIAASATAQKQELISPPLFLEKAIKFNANHWEWSSEKKPKALRHKASGMVCAEGHGVYILIDVTTGRDGAGCAWASPDWSNKNVAVAVEPLKDKTLGQLKARATSQLSAQGMKMTGEPMETTIGGCPAVRVTFVSTGRAIGGSFFAMRGKQLWTIGFFALGSDKQAAQNGAIAEVDAKAYVADMLKC